MMIPGTQWPLLETYRGNLKLIQNLSEVSGTTMAPHGSQVFEALKLTAPEDVKVIVVGQDPYIRGEAHGLAFSSQKGMTPSLDIIFKELEQEGFKQKSPDLTRWAEQGVLLLNTILTTKLGESLAHEKFGWQQFTKAVVRYVINLGQPVIVLLWGGHAKDFWLSIQKTIHVDNLMHIGVLYSAHPIAEARGSGKFTGNNHFGRANEWLEEHGRTPINWSDDEQSGECAVLARHNSQ